MALTDERVKAQLENVLTMAINAMHQSQPRDYHDALHLLATNLAAHCGCELVPATPRGARVPSGVQFVPLEPTSEAELAGLLQRGGLDLTTWGVGKAKSPKSLFEELQKKKCSLEIGTDGSLRRVTTVVGCKLLHAGRLLIASHEIFPTHTVDKSALVSAKLNAGADWRAIVRKTLSSTLQLDAAACALDDHSYTETLESELSASFPGLHTVYKLATVEISLAAGPPPHLAPDGPPIELHSSTADPADPGQTVGVARVYEWVSLDAWAACHCGARDDAAPLRFRRPERAPPGQPPASAPEYPDWRGSDEQLLLLLANESTPRAARLRRGKPGRMSRELAEIPEM